MNKNNTESPDNIQFIRHVIARIVQVENPTDERTVAKEEKKKKIQHTNDPKNPQDHTEKRKEPHYS